MLEPYRHVLDSMKIILASGSPRRKEILQQLGLNFLTQDSAYDESELNPMDFEKRADYVATLAQRKIQHLKVSESEKPDLIIGADTIVVCDGEIYGKPCTTQKAAETLRKLSGRTHEVHTGVAMQWSNSFPAGSNNTECAESFSCRTLVKIADLSEVDIEAYISTGEPLDKAGAYGIQGLGGSIVEWVHGDFYNVMGLPMNELCKHMAKRLQNYNS